MLEVMNDPTFPAITIEIIVGANSKIIVSLVAKPTRYVGYKEPVIFRANWIVITPPIKNETKEMIPNELITVSPVSFIISCLITDHLVGLSNIFFNIIKYRPILCKKFISKILSYLK